MCVQFAALIAPNQDIAFVLAAGALRFFGCDFVWRVYESVWVWSAAGRCEPHTSNPPPPPSHQRRPPTTQPRANLNRLRGGVDPVRGLHRLLPRVLPLRQVRLSLFVCMCVRMRVCACVCVSGVSIVSSELPATHSLLTHPHRRTPKHQPTQNTGGCSGRASSSSPSSLSP